MMWLWLVLAVYLAGAAWWWRLTHEEPASHRVLLSALWPVLLLFLIWFVLSIRDADLAI